MLHRPGHTHREFSPTAKSAQVQLALNTDLFYALMRWLQVKAICEEMNIGFLGVGFDPKWEIKNIPVMPKDR